MKNRTELTEKIRRNLAESRKASERRATVLEEAKRKMTEYRRQLANDNELVAGIDYEGEPDYSPVLTDEEWEVLDDYIDTMKLVKLLADQSLQNFIRERGMTELELKELLSKKMPNSNDNCNG